MTKEEVRELWRRINKADRLFDGHYENGVVLKDRNAAYNDLRHIVNELMKEVS